jgi:hypothetical protein
MITVSWHGARKSCGRASAAAIVFSGEPRDPVPPGVPVVAETKTVSGGSTRKAVVPIPMAPWSSVTMSLAR